jgi:hypothetical protein
MNSADCRLASILGSAPAPALLVSVAPGLPRPPDPQRNTDDSSMKYRLTTATSSTILRTDVHALRRTLLHEKSDG